MLNIAFCTTCKNRTQHLRETLPANIADNQAYAKLKFIVLDYNSSDDLLEYLKSSFYDLILSKRLTVYSYRGHDRFRMAHAKNMAHRCGILEGADILVNLDADNFTGPGFAQFVNDQFKAAAGPMFLWSRMIKEGQDRLPRGISGRIAVTKDSFLRTGGYDEQFNTWGPDDKDFNLRLRRLGHKGWEIDRKFLRAINHTEKMRFKEYPHVQSQIDGEDAFTSVNESDATVVNFGMFGLGEVFKNFDEYDATILRPMATRIFGIGMHKTATTSLNTALRMLGLSSGHWKSAHWAKAIYEEMIASGRSHTLEQYYALCDVPIPILYEKLDRAYPGSKFILTVRDEFKWLQSVEKHWSYEHNEFRRQWDTDPFTHKVHKLLYGQKNFNAEIFVRKYRQHNCEVQSYFKNRPGQLLVLEMDRGGGWKELCSFLECPIPDGDYPKVLATPELGVKSGETA